MFSVLLHALAAVLLIGPAHADIEPVKCPGNQESQCTSIVNEFTPVPERVLEDIIGQAAPRWREKGSTEELNSIVDSKLIGTFFNGNIDWTIENLVIEVRLGNGIFEKYPVTFENGHLKPLSKSEFTIDIKDPESLPDSYFWRIYQANGFKVN